MQTTLAVIGDPHGAWEALGRVVDHLREHPVDGVLVVGDFFSQMVLGRELTDGELATMDRDLDRTLRALDVLGLPVLWVPGNHDRPSLAGDGNVDRGVQTIQGVRVAGIGGAGPNRFGFHYEWDEEDIRARTIPACDVLLCHTPPAETPLDVTAWGGHHAGSAAIRELAESHDGVLVCGHIHEAAGGAQVGRALCLNAGALGEPHGKAQVGRIERDAAGEWHVVHLDLESGRSRRWSRDV